MPLSHTQWRATETEPQDKAVELCFTATKLGMKARANATRHEICSTGIRTFSRASFVANSISPQFLSLARVIS